MAPRFEGPHGAAHEPIRLGEFPLGDEDLRARLVPLRNVVDILQPHEKLARAF